MLDLMIFLETMGVEEATKDIKILVESIYFSISYGNKKFIITKILETCLKLSSNTHFLNDKISLKDQRDKQFLNDTVLTCIAKISVFFLKCTIRAFQHYKCCYLVLYSKQFSENSIVI